MHSSKETGAGFLLIHLIWTPWLSPIHPCAVRFNFSGWDCNGIFHTLTKFSWSRWSDKQSFVGGNFCDQEFCFYHRTSGGELHLQTLYFWHHIGRKWTPQWRLHKLWSVFHPYQSRRMLTETKVNKNKRLHYLLKNVPLENCTNILINFSWEFWSALTITVLCSYL